MYPKKRLELIIEKPAFKRACRILETSGVTGYSAIPCIAGYGSGNRWQRGTDLSASQDMIVIISILDEQLLEGLTEKFESLIGSHIGVLSICDVNVIRNDRF